MDTGSKSLPYGIYFGASEIHHEIPGFSVSLLAPTLRAEDVPLHTHENASFVFVVAGLYRSSADGTPPVCPVSTLIFNPAGTAHCDSFALANGRFLAVSISDQSLRIAADGTALPTAATAFAFGDAVATALRLVQQCLSPGVENAEAMEALCWELLSRTAKTALWPEKNLPSWTQRARELLHDQCAEPLQMTDVARQLGVHPVYFARAFRQVFCCTPGEYRTRCRLHKAMDLMRNGRLSLSDIALVAGFFDQSHFTKAFREHFGSSPYAYRRRLHGRLQSSEVQFIQETTSQLEHDDVRRPTS
jgi:AraC family transcriptional regulator